MNKAEELKQISNENLNHGIDTCVEYYYTKILDLANKESKFGKNKIFISTKIDTLSNILSGNPITAEFFFNEYKESRLKL